MDKLIYKLHKTLEFFYRIGTVNLRKMMLLTDSLKIAKKFVYFIQFPEIESCAKIS